MRVDNSRLFEIMFYWIRFRGTLKFLAWFPLNLIKVIFVSKLEEKIDRLTFFVLFIVVFLLNDKTLLAERFNS